MGQKQEGPDEEEQAGSDLPDPQKRQHHGAQAWTGARAPPQAAFILVKSACLILQGCQAVHRQRGAEREKEGSEKLCTFITKSDLTAPGEGEQTSKNTLLLTVF